MALVYQRMWHWYIKDCDTGISKTVTLVYQRMWHWYIKDCGTGISKTVTLVYQRLWHWYIKECDTGISKIVVLVSYRLWYWCIKCRSTGVTKPETLRIKGCDTCVSLYIYITSLEISRSSQCSTTSVTKAVVCAILSVGWCI